MLLEGKTALVTGASRGIGRAIAIKLASEGAAVAINYAGNAKAAEEVKSIIEQAGGKAMLVQADISSAEAVDEMVSKVVEGLGGIDILVNNAGITKDNLILRMSEEDFDDVISINLKGAFLCSKEAAKQMLRKKSGRIINISSVVGIGGNAGQANYASSKAGMIGLAKSLAKELGGKGITVNVVAPGFIQTDMTAELSEDMKKYWEQQIPRKRAGSPEDVANVVCFLAASESDYITGQVININGGMCM